MFGYKYPRYTRITKATSLEFWELCHLHAMFQKAVGLPRRATPDQVQVALPEELRDAYWTAGDLISSLTQNITLRGIENLASVLGYCKTHMDKEWIAATNDYRSFARRFERVTTRNKKDSKESFKQFGLNIDLSNPQERTFDYIKSLTVADES